MPEHTPLTRRGQFGIKQTIKEEKLARKGLGKGVGQEESEKEQGETQTGKRKGKGKGKGRVKQSKKETQTQKTVTSKRKARGGSGKGGKAEVSNKRKILKTRVGTKKQKAEVASEVQPVGEANPATTQQPMLRVWSQRRPHRRSLPRGRVVRKESVLCRLCQMPRPMSPKKSSRNRSREARARLPLQQAKAKLESRPQSRSQTR